MIDPQLTADMAELGSADGARITRPGKWIIRREGGEANVQYFN